MDPVTNEGLGLVAHGDDQPGQALACFDAPGVLVRHPSIVGHRAIGREPMR
jgi:hypothetical protein